MPRPRGVRTAALVAAVAVALTWFQFVGWDNWVQWGGSRDEPPGSWLDWKEQALKAAQMATPFAAVLASTLLALRLRSPRPPLWRLARRPGTAACLAASVALAHRAIEMANSTWKDYLTEFRWQYNFQHSFLFLPHEEGLAVAVAWLVLGVGGRLRPEPTWLERAGRAVGGFFLACAALRWVYYW
jgi:hypothetical protein